MNVFREMRDVLQQAAEAILSLHHPTLNFNAQLEYFIGQLECVTNQSRGFIIERIIHCKRPGETDVQTAQRLLNQYKQSNELAKPVDPPPKLTCCPECKGKVSFIGKYAFCLDCDWTDLESLE